MRILHAIHDFLPRHRAGSEIYAHHLTHELARRHAVTILCAEYDPARPHGSLTWRVHDGVPVVELVNNWAFSTFEETYASPELNRSLRHVLAATDPDVLHVHNLLNLSMDLPALARERGAAIVATLHDYTLLCPSGGQRVHMAEQHVCHVIEPDRCSRCFPQSRFASQMAVSRAARVAARVPALDAARRSRPPPAPARVLGHRAERAYVGGAGAGGHHPAARQGARSLRRHRPVRRAVTGPGRRVRGRRPAREEAAASPTTGSVPSRRPQRRGSRTTACASASSACSSGTKASTC